MLPPRKDCGAFFLRISKPQFQLRNTTHTIQKVQNVPLKKTVSGESKTSDIYDVKCRGLGMKVRMFDAKKSDVFDFRFPSLPPSFKKNPEKVLHFLHQCLRFPVFSDSLRCRTGCRIHQKGAGKGEGGNPDKVMRWQAENVRGRSEEGADGAASMAHKRHFASGARGLSCFF